MHVIAPTPCVLYILSSRTYTHPCVSIIEPIHPPRMYIYTHISKWSICLTFKRFFVDPLRRYMAITHRVLCTSTMYRTRQETWGGGEG